MKLEKYVDKSKKKRKTVLISLGVIVLISVSLVLYKTFASFTESAEFQVMKGKIDYFGNSDIYFAFYKGDEQLDTMPVKDNSEGLVFDHAECDNGASILWNESEWAPLVKGLNKVKTKCSLYFDEKPTFDQAVIKCGQAGTNAATCIKNNANLDSTNLMADDTSEANIRYVGATVNNYIDIGDRDGNGNPILWRIIGVMNNMTNLDNGGQKESLVKIIRAEDIGKFISWDSSTSEINSGYGVNEWSEADIMKLLNPQNVYSGTSEIGGSLYWNKGSGNCYYSSEEKIKPCEFTSSGLSEEAKQKIAKVKWNTGTIEKSYFTVDITVKDMYEGERSNHNGKEHCENTGGKYCNDKVPRTTTWDGYIGLIYPSDYGYAVGGAVRNICLKSIGNSKNNCATNNWLTPKQDEMWTMTPQPVPTYSSSLYGISDSGILNTDMCFNGAEEITFPVAYLKSNTKITGGTGEKGSPFILEI